MADDTDGKPALFLVNGSGLDHEITPRYRSIHTTTGIPVTGLDPRDFPLNAICLVCERVVTCRHYMASWVHVEG